MGNFNFSNGQRYSIFVVSFKSAHVHKKSKQKEKMKTTTVPKGYRLKPDTHELIEKVRFELKCSNDKLIKEAVKLYQKNLSKTIGKSK